MAIGSAPICPPVMPTSRIACSFPSLFILTYKFSQPIRNVKDIR